VGKVNAKKIDLTTAGWRKKVQSDNKTINGKAGSGLAIIHHTFLGLLSKAPQIFSFTASRKGKRGRSLILMFMKHQKARLNPSCPNELRINTYGMC
jgi:hypothetical protein